MSSVGRWSVPNGRIMTSTILVVLGLFALGASLGAASWLVLAVAVAAIAAAIAWYVISAVTRGRDWVEGTAFVLSCTAPPAGTTHGRCLIRVILHVAGLSDVQITLREPRVEVAKWPIPRDRLPVIVPFGEPRRARVLWAQRQPHLGPGAAAEDVEEMTPETPTDLLELAAGSPTMEMLAEPITTELPVPTLDEPSADLPLPELDGPPAVLIMEVIQPGLRRRPSPGPAAERAARERLVPHPVVPTARRPLDDPSRRGGLGPLSPVDPSGRVDPSTPVDPPSPPTGSLGLRTERVTLLEPPVLAILEPDAPAQVTAELASALLEITPRPGVTRSSAAGIEADLFVADLGRSVEFYRDVLGFTQVGVGLGGAILGFGAGRIVLRRVADLKPVDRRLLHLLVEVDDLDLVYADLQARGVQFVHRPCAIGRQTVVTGGAGFRASHQQLELWSAMLRDPDGHGIALTCWRS